MIKVDSVIKSGKLFIHSHTTDGTSRNFVGREFRENKNHYSKCEKCGYTVMIVDDHVEKNDLRKARKHA